MSDQITKTDPQAPAETRRENWRRPQYEVTPGKEAYELRVHLPGVPKKQAEVTVEGDRLLVVGRRGTIRPEGAKLVHEEIGSEDYRLPLQLNVDIDAEKIEAHSADGVLNVRLPLAEESRPRAIQVE
jgi:HSP20 family protein